MAASRVFSLQSYRSPTQNAKEPFHCTVITPNDVEITIVRAAWSYAVRYTAKGLDIPDHEAALELLMQRHPSWQIIRSAVQTVPIDLSFADNDKPEA